MKKVWVRIWLRRAVTLAMRVLHFPMDMRVAYIMQTVRIKGAIK